MTTPATPRTVTEYVPVDKQRMTAADHRTLIGNMKPSNMGDRDN